MLSVFLVAAWSQSQAELAKWQSPPATESSEIIRLIDAAKSELESGVTISKTLSNPRFDEARPYPRFRELIRRFAEVGAVTMVSPAEQGEKLELTFRLGIPKVLIYVYHTDARGAYAKNAVHFQANSGDMKHARLFAYVITDDRGQATLRTIRPAGYPKGELPQHVHYHIETSRPIVREIWFSDDPRLTPAMRERGRNEATIVTPQKTSAGWKATADISIP